MNWPLYERILALLFEPLLGEDGIPEDELAAAEGRLDMPLPPLLRQLYSLCGRRGDLHQACEYLILPPALQVHETYLPFYQNTPQQSRWTIPIRVGQSDDPPVFRESAGSWEPDYPKLSEFLLAMLFWQAVNGGMGYFAHGTLPRATLESLALGLERTALGGSWALEALWGEGLVVVSSTAETSDSCQVLCGYNDTPSVAELVLPGAEWEHQGRRKGRIRSRAHDPSDRCGGCGRSKLTWGDTSRGVCARCGHPL